MDVRTAIRKLQSDPYNFLRKHPISTGTGMHGQAGFCVEEMIRDTGTRTTSVRARNVAATEGLRITRTDGEVQVQGWSVMMHQWDGQGFDWLNISAPAANLPKFIFTGRLSGCSFVVEDMGGGAIRCAHQKHGAGPNSDTLRRTVAGLQGVVAYTSGGQYDFAKSQADVIGVAHDGHWRIYAQRQSPGANSGVNVDGVDRIF